MMGVSRRTLTWATIAAAVVSALLLGGGFARLADPSGDAMRVRRDALVSAASAGERPAAGSNPQPDAAPVRDRSPR